MRDLTTPFTELEHLLERMSRQFEESAAYWEDTPALEVFTGGSTIRVDIAEAEDEFVVTADIPGFEREDITVSVDGRTLRIEAERSESETEADERMIKSEREHRTMSRSVRLPEEVDAEGTTAALHNGVLTVTLPRHEGGGGLQIDVE